MSSPPSPTAWPAPAPCLPLPRPSQPALPSRLAAPGPGEEEEKSRKEETKPQRPQGGLQNTEPQQLPPGPAASPGHVPPFLPQNRGRGGDAQPFPKPCWSQLGTRRQLRGTRFWLEGQEHKLPAFFFWSMGAVLGPRALREASAGLTDALSSGLPEKWARATKATGAHEGPARGRPGAVRLPSCTEPAALGRTGWEATVPICCRAESHTGHIFARRHLQQRSVGCIYSPGHSPCPHSARELLSPSPEPPRAP